MKATTMKTNELTRTRIHAIPANFWFANKGAGSASVTTIDISELVAMVDCEHAAGVTVAVVSKPARGCEYTTTVLVKGVDGKGVFWRAGHGTGLVSFWKGVAKRRAGTVVFVRGADEYRPGGPAMEGVNALPEGLSVREQYLLAVQEREALSRSQGKGPATGGGLLGYPYTFCA